MCVYASVYKRQSTDNIQEVETYRQNPKGKTEKKIVKMEIHSKKAEHKMSLKIIDVC